MRAHEFLPEVNIDNTKGAGAVPYNAEIAYFGLRVYMRPSTFLKLALPLEEPTSVDGLAKHIQAGGAIGAPFLDITIPPEWEDGDFSAPARVRGHEGRNRMTAIMKVEGDAPVEVHLIPGGGMRRRDLTTDMISAMSARLIPERQTAPVQGPLFDINTVSEGVKSTLAGLGLAAAAGLGGAYYDYQKDPEKGPEIMKSIFSKSPAPQSQPAPKDTTVADKIDTALKGVPPYEVLKAVAKQSGIAGRELTQFIAQMAHESMGFKRMQEIGEPEYFNKYDIAHNPKKAKSLGNVKPGDGERFKGRGFVQLTGRYNYRKAGQALGLPLEQHPELVEDPETAAKVAVWYWKSRVQPRVKDFTDVRASTTPINPGLKGLKDRKKKYAYYKAKYGK